MFPGVLPDWIISLTNLVSGASSLTWGGIELLNLTAQAAISIIGMANPALAALAAFGVAALSIFAAAAIAIGTALAAYEIALLLDTTF